MWPMKQHLTALDATFLELEQLHPRETLAAARPKGSRLTRDAAASSART